MFFPIFFQVECSGSDHVWYSKKVNFQICVGEMGHVPIWEKVNCRILFGGNEKRQDLRKGEFPNMSGWKMGISGPQQK